MGNSFVRRWLHAVWLDRRWETNTVPDLPERYESARQENAVSDEIHSTRQLTIPVQTLLANFGGFREPGGSSCSTATRRHCWSGISASTSFARRVSDSCHPRQQASGGMTSGRPS